MGLSVAINSYVRPFALEHLNSITNIGRASTAEEAETHNAILSDSKNKKSYASMKSIMGDPTPTDNLEKILKCHKILKVMAIVSAVVTCLFVAATVVLSFAIIGAAVAGVVTIGLTIALCNKNKQAKVILKEYAERHVIRFQEIALNVIYKFESAKQNIIDNNADDTLDVNGKYQLFIHVERYRAASKESVEVQNQVIAAKIAELCKESDYGRNDYNALMPIQNKLVIAS